MKANVREDKTPVVTTPTPSKKGTGKVTLVAKGGDEVNKI